MAIISEIEIYRGEEITINFTMTPVEPITGWTIHFTVSKVANSPQKIIPSVVAQIVNGAGGTFRVSLDADDTDRVPGTYFWDASRVDVDNERVLAAGDFVILGRAKLPLSS